MHIKIQGGGTGTHANTGSAAGIVTYLQHEDAQRLTQGEHREHFFNQDQEQISPQEVTYKLDHNRAQLHKADAKFYVLTVNPSAEEITLLGSTPEQRSEALKEYIRKDVMQQYAENFGKNLNAQDIEYYAKIHHSRNAAGEQEMHAHIIVSRKDKANRIKLSPRTNHRNTRKGAVKGGFDRENFFINCERSFDRRTGMQREYTQTYEYKNAMKHGTPQQMQTQIRNAQAHQVAARNQQQKRVKIQVKRQIKGRSL